MHVLTPRLSAAYDRRAAVYDAIVGRSLYHRTFWGTSTDAYARFGRAALEAARDGHFAEVGCGSLLFTAPMYLAAHAPSIVLVDRSLRMLCRGLGRLASARHALPERIIVLQADAAALPVRTGTLSAILSLNVLHVPCERRAIISECARTLVPGRGRFFVSALVRSGRWSDAWLALLHRAGELAAPVTVDELREMVAGRWAVVESMAVEGNMCFLVVRHAG
jgi:SAM-dependent methyltransferase